MVFWGYLLAPAERTSASSFTHFENYFKFYFENPPRFETGFTRMFLQFTQTKALISTCNTVKIHNKFEFFKNNPYSLNHDKKVFNTKHLTYSQNHITTKFMRSGTIKPSPCHGPLKNLKNIKPQL